MPGTTVAHGQDIFTVIFEATGLGQERQQEALSVIKRLLAEVVCRQPGFLGAHVHLSHDGDQLVHYQQWASRDAFLAFKAGPATEIMPKVAPFGIMAKTYEVVYSQYPLQ